MKKGCTILPLIKLHPVCCSPFLCVHEPENRHALSPDRPNGACACRGFGVAPLAATLAGAANFLSGNERGVCSANRPGLDWNVGASGVGYVTRFAVDAEFPARYPVQNVGADIHDELWVPAEELESFNDHIVGLIEVTQTFR